MWQNFNVKQLRKKKNPKKNGRYGNPQHTFFTNGIYFYDVGSTYAIDQKINHLHTDRVANMHRNNVPSVCGRG